MIGLHIDTWTASFPPRAPQWWLQINRISQGRNKHILYVSTALSDFCQAIPFGAIYSHYHLVFHFILYLAREIKLFGLEKERGIWKSQSWSYSVTELGTEEISQVSQPHLCTKGCFTLVFLKMSHLIYPVGISRTRLTVTVA